MHGADVAISAVAGELLLPPKVVTAIITFLVTFKTNLKSVCVSRQFSFASKQTPMEQT